MAAQSGFRQILLGLAGLRQGGWSQRRAECRVQTHSPWEMKTADIDIEMLL